MPFDIYLGSKEAKTPYRRYALWTGFPATWPSMRYTLLFNLLTLLTPLALLDNVHGAIEHQASGYKDSKVRYIGNRKARE